MAGSGGQPAARAPASGDHRSRRRRRAADGHAGRTRFQHIVFNGEVYNYRALRADSAVARRTLRERQRHGSAAAPRRTRRRGSPGRGSRHVRVRLLGRLSSNLLLVARDRFGIKPLYVAAGSRAHRVCVGARGVARVRGLGGGETSAAGVLAFLEWGSVPPPLTWQRGIDMLEPGTWRRWRLDGRDERGVFADARIACSSNASPRRSG